MTNILVRCANYRHAKEYMYNVIEKLPKQGVVINKVQRVIGLMYFETDNCNVTFISQASNILGRKADMVYGFGRRDSLYLTRGKIDGPTLPLVDYICKIEKGE